MESTDLTVHQPSTDVTQSVATRFDGAMIETIRRTVASTLNEPEFRLYLEVAARYQLNPLTGEIWATKMGGKFTPIVGRDGFLAIANRNPEYEGMDSDVVRANDTLRKLPDGTYEHTFELSPNHERGAIIGAFAVVFRKGRRPTRYFAPVGEYDTGNNAWRTHKTAMILKCAQVTALKHAFNLSGIYAQEEMQHLVGESAAAPADAPVDLGDDEVGQRLRELIDAANRLRPGSYRPAKVRMMLGTATEEERRAFMETLEREVAAGVPAAAPPDAVVIPEDPRALAAHDAMTMAQHASDPEDAAVWRDVSARAGAAA